MLHVETAAEVLDETLTEVTRTLVDAIPDEQVADMLEAMPMDVKIPGNEAFDLPNALQTR